MKGQVIVGAPEPEEDSEAGDGLACPSCGADMRKTIHSNIHIELTGADEVDVSSSVPGTVYICDVCGYREEVERQQ